MCAPGATRKPSAPWTSLRKARRCFPSLLKCNGFEPATTVPVLLLVNRTDAQRATRPAPYYLLVEVVKIKMQILLLTARMQHCC